jgi:hypothetical protein
MNVYGGLEAYINVFLSSALDGDESSDASRGRFTAVQIESDMH